MAALNVLATRYAAAKHQYKANQKLSKKRSAREPSTTMRLASNMAALHNPDYYVMKFIDSARKDSIEAAKKRNEQSSSSKFDPSSENKDSPSAASKLNRSTIKRLDSGADALDPTAISTYYVKKFINNARGKKVPASLKRVQSKQEGSPVAPVKVAPVKVGPSTIYYARKFIKNTKKKIEATKQHESNVVSISECVATDGEASKTTKGIENNREDPAPSDKQSLSLPSIYFVRKFITNAKGEKVPSSLRRVQTKRDITREEPSPTSKTASMKDSASSVYYVNKFIKNAKKKALKNVPIHQDNEQDIHCGLGPTSSDEIGKKGEEMKKSNNENEITSLASAYYVRKFVTNTKGKKVPGSLRLVRPKSIDRPDYANSSLSDQKIPSILHLNKTNDDTLQRKKVSTSSENEFTLSRVSDSHVTKVDRDLTKGIVVDEMAPSTYYVKKFIRNAKEKGRLDTSKMRIPTKNNSLGRSTGTEVIQPIASAYIVNTLSSENSKQSTARHIIEKPIVVENNDNENYVVRPSYHYDRQSVNSVRKKKITAPP
eukprot:TCONS_00068186-protein